MTVGVLALQGAFARHIEICESLEAPARAVRTEADLAACDRLILPGGESSTMSLLLDRLGLFEPIRRRISDGMAVFGTCAGAILLSRTILDGRADQHPFGALDVTIRRNAYGRQAESFECQLDVPTLGPPPLNAVFIRAPVIEEVGDGVSVLASLAGNAVCCSARGIMISTFHPELSGDDRLHRMFLENMTTA